MRTSPRALVPALALCALAGPAENLFENGAVDGSAGWSHTGGGGSVSFAVDGDVGADAPGSLAIANTDPADRAPHNWRQSVALAGAPGRLELSAAVRLDGAAPGTEACVVANLYDAAGEAVGHVRCSEVRADSDWTRVATVFEPEPGAARIHVMAYLVGAGTVWFDDLVLAGTDAPVTARTAPVARGNDPGREALARGAASDLPWLFDAAEALERARAEDRPVLLYVRCTDDREHLESARTSLAAEAVRFADDGYAKDVLFRSGPLSDPDVRALVRRRFVPLCLTYVLSDHTYGAPAPPAWGATGMDGARLAAVADEGDRGPGCLVIENDDPADTRAHNWFQRIEAPADLPTVLELSASIRAEGFGRGSEACVMVQCWAGDEAVAYGRVQEVLRDRDWKTASAKFSVPAGTTHVRLLAYLVGAGRASFDDFAIRPARGRGENLLANPGLDRLAGDWEGLPVSPRDTTTPALVVLDPDGAVVRRIHRFGALSAELCDRWLRGVLAETGAAAAGRAPLELFLDGELARLLRATAGADDPETRVLRARARLRDGDLERALSEVEGLDDPGAHRVRGVAAMRAGDFAGALPHLARAMDDAELGADARFRAGLCLDRLGRHADARAMWEAALGPTPDGRRAAACLLDAGPRLHLAMTERAWPFGDELPEETEAGRPGPFDAAPSVRALCEMQRADGSFGSQQGPEGLGWSDAAITALCVDALRAWEAELDDELAARGRAARARALDWLCAFSARPHGSDGFNLPYALATLVREGRAEAAQRVVARMAETQLPDGNWTVYHAERPASFNTALAVRALARAREAGLDVPRDVFERGADALEAMRRESGRFPYSTAPGHEWMTTEHGSIARDPLCELALLEAGRGSRKTLDGALERYATWAHELRAPTKRLYDYFNPRGHGGYYFFFAHRNAVEAAERAKKSVARRARAVARDEVLAAREGDGTFLDKFLLGRAYGTAMALLVLAD